jgi:hypothetical protein
MKSNTWVKWVEVESENIKKFCYRNGKLFVVFAKSPTEVFVYRDVPEATMKRLYKAESVGSFINKHIKPNHKLATKLKTEA